MSQKEREKLFADAIGDPVLEARKLEYLIHHQRTARGFISGKERNRTRSRYESLIGAVVRGDPIRGGQEANRNAPCPCGSGRKYKRCCLPAGRRWRRPIEGGAA